MSPAVALLLLASAGASPPPYAGCYGEMAISILAEVSEGATEAAARDFAADWLRANADVLSGGFTEVTNRLLDDLNVDRHGHPDAVLRGVRRWRDCVVAVYEDR